MKIPRSIWIWLLAAADIGASTHAQTVTNTVFQKHLTNGWFIKVSEEITENTRPSVHHTNGVVSRFSDCQHWYRFLLGTNSFNAPRQILETEASSFKNDTYSPYRVLDVNLDTTNLVVAYKKRGATFCATLSTWNRSRGCRGSLPRFCHLNMRRDEEISVWIAPKLRKDEMADID